MNLSFWYKWSLRDLRQHWLQVVAIAIIIALGTGVYSGLGSQQQWREDSYDQSYAQLNMFDLHLTLTEGSFLPATELHEVLNNIDGVEDAEVRLIVPTLVDASTESEMILVPGKIVGVDVAAGEPTISKISIEAGRGFSTTDTNAPVAVLDYLFARYYDLRPGDSLRISGDIALEFIGTGQTPESFQIIPSETSFFLGESNYAVLYMPLDRLQHLQQRDDMVNDAVITITDSAQRNIVRQNIETTLATAFPTTGSKLISSEEDPVYSLLYGDAKGDQKIWNLIAFLFLAGAGMATFNLAGRLVESQRRQIGIGMALGVQRYRLAIRPLLVGLQIALLGTFLGLGFGYILSHLFLMLMRDLMPLPHWSSPFYIESYWRAAILGILIPLSATLYPVWRAVRVQPLEAITTGHLIAKGGGLTPLLQVLPLPGKSFSQMPIRNLLRAPWRSLLTLLGVAVAIILLTVMVGFLDTFVATLDRAETAYLERSPKRMNVLLDTFYPQSIENESTPVSRVRAITSDDGTPLLNDVETGIILPGKLAMNGTEIEISMELIDLDNSIWVPSLLRGTLTTDRRGIILSEKAAQDLDVDVGDRVTLTHPIKQGLFSYGLADSNAEILAIHNNPLRTLSYMHLDHAEMMGIAGMTNYLIIQPSTSVSQNEIRRALFAQEGITSVQIVADISKHFEDALAIFINFLRIVQGVVLILAFLIAFNSTSINIDERTREIATMFAFGLRIRTVTRMQIMENAVIGLLATIVGIVVGYLVLLLVFAQQFDELMPHVKFTITIAPSTVVIAGVLGVIVVALTPLLSIRKMVHMDIPSTLRVME